MADDSGRLNDVLAETSFLFGGNAEFVEALQAKWAADPSSVEPSWAAFFTTLSDSADSVKRLAEPPSWAPEVDDQPRPDWLSAIDGVWPSVEGRMERRIVETSPAARPDEVRARTLDSLRAIMMIRAYRMRGHLRAKLDPLGIDDYRWRRQRARSRYLRLRRERLTTGRSSSTTCWGSRAATVREILALLKRTYCGTVGVQYMHITNPSEKAWLQRRIEGRDKEISFTKEGKIAILKKLIEAEGFEQFLAKRYPGAKRFGLDGAESAVPAMEQIIKRGGALG